MIKSLRLAAVAVMALTVAACQTTTHPYQGSSYPVQSQQTMGNKQVMGAVIGGIAGGALANEKAGKNHKVLATALGVGLGGLIGSSVGASLDRMDRMYLEQAAQKAMENGRSNAPVAWSNPDSQNSGTITPQRAYAVNGTYCREFTQSIFVGGKKQEAYGTACRQPDGTWKVQ